MEQARGPHFDLFDALRILAAVTVIYWHSYPLTGRPVPVIPFLARAGINYSDLAVGAFFAMSGFLVTMSFMRSTSGRYTLNRAARLMPGLAVVILLAALVVGPLVSDLPAHAYFRDPLVLKYTAYNLVFKTFYLLPGVFTHNPYPRAVNGSLWTLPFEVGGYAAVLCLGLVGALRHRTWMIACAAAILAFHVLMVDSHPAHPASLFVQTAQFSLFFVVGVLCYLYLDAVRSRPRLFVLLGVLGVVMGSAARVNALAIIGLALLVILAGMRSSAPVRSFRRLGDPSYGTYINAFLVQQVVVHLGWASTPATLFLLATPISLAVGFVSWHVVENPILRWAKNRSRGGQRPSRPAGPAIPEEPLPVHEARLQALLPEARPTP